MNINTPTNTVLYSIEKTIKTYRKFGQQNISRIIPDITVDQTLILIIIDGNNLTQTEIADLVFKDYASMTRIIKLMEKKNYLTKTADDNDRRKAKLEITQQGQKVLKQLKPVIQQNRIQALSTVSDNEIKQLFRILKKITNNCQTQDK